MLHQLKKIKAFTLSEVLVSMVLMMIVIGIAMSVLNILYKNLYAIQNNISGQTDLEQLELVLSIDAHRFPLITRRKNTITFSNAIDSISYYWIKDEKLDNDVPLIHLMRERDTLLSEPIAIKSYRFGKQKTIGVLDALKIELPQHDMALFIYQPQDVHQNMLEHGF